MVANATIRASGDTRMPTLIMTGAILHFRVGFLNFRPPNLRNVLESWRQVIAIAIPAFLTNIMPSVATGL